MKHLKTFIILVVVVVIAAAIIVLRPRRYDATIYPMGGIPTKIVVYGRNLFEFDEDVSAVEARVAELEKVFDRHRETSEISRINADAGGAPMAMSATMERMVVLSRHWSSESDGAFDPTIGPLVELWKEAAKTQVLPSDVAIAQARELVGMKHVLVSNSGKILLPHKGMSLDFGAIAKGFIVDAAIAVLKDRGVAGGLIEAGGDAYAFGSESFAFGIQDPTQEGNALVARVTIDGGAVVTSGTYRRYSEIEGKRYPHIIDPRTGRPVSNHLLSATIVGGNGADADALATAVMVLGLHKGVEIVQRLSGFEAVLIEQTETGMEVWVSPDLMPKLTFTKDWADRVHLFGSGPKIPEST